MSWPRRALLLAPLGACARSPDPALFTLAALPGEARPGGPKTVELRRPGLAGYLDRPEIVRAAGPYRVDLSGGARWAEPLGDMLGRVLAETLTQRLPGSTVFTEAGGLSADGDAVVEIDVQRFDADAEGRVTLLAQIAVRRPGNRRVGQTRAVRLEVPARSTAITDIVAAMSATLGQLANTVAAMLRTL
ncbi:membrane integrity-associated transporter subunit PqiC [Dankookia rubra]|uniref:Membrane integrity-associated transporter subunit PqiC n=1 Tax=Dankookia rubra TaxID=1442381 RepID=A0A4R5QA39_9PROT|nr:PqiC family protein [Dankookia rubra]TDH59211.1 membrane integrity-associated transporter subunit PqiC [Dankookia rubra]